MISIIMPAYNAEPYIDYAIQSVLSQTYTNWELIIIDDCSTDNTASIVDRHRQNHPQIHYIHNSSSKGPGPARNQGISYAHGNWIAFLDSDDAWRCDKLQLQLSCADTHNGNFIFSGSSFIDEKGTSLSYTLEVPFTINYTDLLKQNLISCSSVLIKKELISLYPMKNIHDIHEDFVTWLSILKDTNNIAYGINEPLLIYRVHPSSKSGNKLKAAGMTWRAYRHVGVKLIPSFFYWSCYAFRSLVKYYKIKSNI